MNPRIAEAQERLTTAKAARQEFEPEQLRIQQTAEALRIAEFEALQFLEDVVKEEGDKLPVAELFGVPWRRNWDGNWEMRDSYGNWRAGDGITDSTIAKMSELLPEGLVLPRREARLEALPADLERSLVDLVYSVGRNVNLAEAAITTLRQQILDAINA